MVSNAAKASLVDDTTVETTMDGTLLGVCFILRAYDKKGFQIISVTTCQVTHHSNHHWNRTLETFCDHNCLCHIFQICNLNHCRSRPLLCCTVSWGYSSFHLGLNRLGLKHFEMGAIVNIQIT